MENLKERLGKSAKYLLASDAIYSLTGMFIDTFLVAYFLKVTNESIIGVSIFYIIKYIILGLGNIAIGKLVKTKPEYSTKILSVGIVLRAIFILFIALLSEKIAIYFPVVAILYGVSEVFYWVAHEVTYIDITTNDNRKDYMSIKKILGTITNIVAPLILGTSIELYSFSKIAIYILIISVIQIIISLRVKSNTKIQPMEYSIKKFIKQLHNNQRKKLGKYTKSAIAYGVIESSIKTLVVIITVMTFKTSFNLGVLTSIFAICSMISLYLFKKYYSKNNAKYVLYICSCLIVVGVLGLLLDINKITLIIYNFIYTVCICVLDTIYNTKKGDLVNECNIEEWKTEWVIVAGLFLKLGRIIGYILMLVAGIMNNIFIFKTLLLVVSLFAPIYAKLMYEVEKFKT